MRSALTLTGISKRPSWPVWNGPNSLGLLPIQFVPALMEARMRIIWFEKTLFGLDLLSADPVWNGPGEGRMICPLAQTGAFAKQQSHVVFRVRVHASRGLLLKIICLLLL